MDEIVVFTDGACSGNPGPGGWSSIIKGKNRIYVLRDYELKTTNNRMELTAVVETLKYLQTMKQEQRQISITSDSSYVINAINKRWIEGWMLKGWKNAKGEPVKNNDLWLKFYHLRKQFSNIKFYWVKGHNGNEMNEMADKNAREMSQTALERLSNL